jgi:uncharacterized membrane protein YphA (DoxX/SURF4 family)
MSTESRIRKYAPWVLSIFISFVFIQSLFFKFTNAPETQYIFSVLNEWGANTLGIERLFLVPGIFNQYVIGSAELIASALLLGGLIAKKPILNALGTLIALGTMTGAIFFHLFTPLGVEVQGDGGTLFVMAVGIWISSLIILFVRKQELCGLMCCNKPKSK